MIFKPSCILIACLAALVAAGPCMAQQRRIFPVPGPQAPPEFPTPDGKKWPNRVFLSAPPTILEMPGLSVEGWFAYDTDHFRLFSDKKITVTSLRELARLLEASWHLNCVLPLNWEPTVGMGREKFQVRIFSQRAAYKAAGGLSGSGGVFSSQRQEILIPAESLGAEADTQVLRVDRQTEAQGTLVHEATHQLMNAWLPNLPLWLSEGAAEYVAAADYSAGEFRMRRHIHSIKEKLEKRLPVQNDGLLAISLEEIMAMDSKRWMAETKAGRGSALYGSVLALTTYFYHGDAAREEEMPIFDFLNEVRKGVRYPAPLAKLLVRDRPFAQLEMDVAKYWANQGVKLHFQSLHPHPKE